MYISAHPMKIIKNLSMEILLSFFTFFSLLNAYSQTLDPNSQPFKLYEKKFHQGEYEHRTGNYEKSIDLFKEALNLARKINLDDGEAKSFVKLGLLYWNIGQLKESSDFYSEALSLAQKFQLKDIKEECLVALEIYKFYSRGKDLRSSNMCQRSIVSFKRAIELARKIGSKEHEVKCLRQMSLIYWQVNSLQEFLALNEEGLILAKDLYHRREEAKCLMNIGLFHWRMDDYSKALRYYENALDISLKIRNKENEAMCLTNISIVYSDLGNYEKALEYMKKAFDIDQRLSNEDSLSMDLTNIGEIFRKKGLLSANKEDFSKAIDYYYDSLKLARKIKNKKVEISSLNNIGLVRYYLNNYQLSLEYFKEAYGKANEIRDYRDMASIINNVGIVFYHLGDYEEAIKCYQKAINLAFKIKFGQILWEAYFGLGQCYEKKDEFSLALTYYKKSIDIIDQIRSRLSLDSYKAGFVRDKLSVYELLIDLLSRLTLNCPSENFEEEIFHTVEKAKARAFLESLGEAKVNILTNLNPSLKKKESEISSRISLILMELANSDISAEKRKLLLKELELKEEEYMSLISKMRIETPEMANLVYPEPCHLEQIQKRLLDEKTALVEYFIGEHKSFMFFITKNNFDLYGLPSRQEIEDSIRAYLKILSTPSEEDFRGTLAAKRLYRELLFPLEKKYPHSIENLIIIPDGTLYYLPFETLIMEDQKLASRNGYLINRYKISYSPSSSALVFLSEKKQGGRSQKSLLAFGNPIYALKESSRRDENKAYEEILRELYINQGFDFSPLPYSKKEILGISKYFPKKKREIYLGNKAKEEIIKMAHLHDYQVIHFACHGFLDEKFPFRSAIILSMDKDPKEDGFLQVREIYNLRLNADLVVLSACQTGKGSLERAEGILGLPRIFFYTGASSVLSSLWKINDKATAIFMRDFYRYLSEGNNKGQALQLAKIKMIKSKFSHPSYWAAFVLYGDSNSALNFN